MLLNKNNMVIVMRFLILCLFIGMFSSHAIGQIAPGPIGARIYAVIDNKFDQSPNHLRTLRDPLPEASPAVLKGLSRLPVSGSSQFTEQALKNVIKSLPAKRIIIVDLREESHGFVNGTPICWVNGPDNSGNKNKTAKEIEEDEAKRLLEVQRNGKVTVHTNAGSEQIVVKSIQTEKQLAESLGIGYYRLPVTDHLHPTDEAVDHFVSFVLSLPKDAWLHFHCKGGVGRTTSFMAMYDMMFNANQVPFDVILKRQNMLGGRDLAKPNDKIEKHQSSLERKEFLNKFYRYCLEVPDFHIAWSSWAKDKN